MSTHVTLPIAPNANPLHIHIDGEECHSLFDERGEPDEAKRLVEELADVLPGNLFAGLLRELLKRELEWAREMGEDERAEVWYAAYMLAAGDPDSAFAPWETVQSYARLVADCPRCGPMAERC